MGQHPTVTTPSCHYPRHGRLPQYPVAPGSRQLLEHSPHPDFFYGHQQVGQ
jgi:hypothetical protein